MTPSTRHAPRGPVFALALCAAAAARAQPVVVEPYYIGASQSLTRETNLVRAPDGAGSVGDTISGTSLLGGMDRTIGRQHVYFNGSAQHNRYRSNRLYDNTAYNLAGGIDWSTVERVSGTLNFSASEQLAAFGQLLGGIYSVDRNIVNSDQLNAVARVGTVTPLTVEGSYAHQRLRYSAERFKFAQFSQDTAGLSLLWSKSPLLTLGANARLVQGRYPQGAFGDDPFTGRSAELSVVWAPSLLSKFSGRLGYSRTRHQDVTQRDFSGVTGSLQWVWQVTGKTRFISQLVRVTGEDASFIVFQAGGPTVASSNFSRVTDTLAFDAQYAATGKITLNGSLRVVHRALDQTVTTAASGSGAGGADNTRTVGLTARYAATRSLQLSCNVGREQRTSSTTLSYAYHASYGGCNAQLLLYP